MNNATYFLLIIYLVIINLVGFVLYAIDKVKAKHKAYRISEKTLLNIACSGGGLGCWMGMKNFHHKTLYKQFRVVLPLWTIIWVGLVVLLLIKW